MFQCSESSSNDGRLSSQYAIWREEDVQAGHSCVSFMAEYMASDDRGRLQFKRHYL
ncbi:hypothetical protein QQ045_004927 [Rhodiola kirilowii]